VAEHLQCGVIIYIMFESRPSVCHLSPPKRRDVRRQNFSCGRVPCVCRTWAGSYVDSGHRWEEIKILKHCAYTCCDKSHAAASFDFGRAAGMCRMPATSSKPAATPRYIYTLQRRAAARQGSQTDGVWQRPERPREYGQMRVTQIELHSGETLY